jgi:DNA-binding transcriptional regulator YhcF (GntR family)
LAYIFWLQVVDKRRIIFLGYLPVAYREKEDEVREWIELIKQAKELGLTLEEVKEWVEREIKWGKQKENKKK